VLEARFNRDDMDLGYVEFRRGDRFVEYFYADRWYNIFAIYDADDDHLKGWYCNVTRPAVFGDGEVHADDLALDVFVFPDGRTLVMDEEEYAALPLTLAERKEALAAVTELQRRARNAEPPFDALSPI
jgi:predicted RNA-binding protein associated with RNAse of E/G family